MSFIELAKARYSCRKLDDRPVEPEKISAVLTAAQVAPTAKNAQPVKIWVIESPEAVEKVYQTTVCTFNAKLFFVIGAYAPQAYVRQYDDRNFADIDAGIVATHMMLEIQDQGLATTWVGNFDPIRMKELFPEMQDYDLVCVFPTGYAAADAHPASRHTEYKPLEELAVRL